MSKWEDWLFDGGTMPGFELPMVPKVHKDSTFYCMKHNELGDFLGRCEGCHAEDDAAYELMQMDGAE